MLYLFGPSKILKFHFSITVYFSVHALRNDKERLLDFNNNKKKSSFDLGVNEILLTGRVYTRCCFPLNLYCMVDLSPKINLILG
jgi:hypothetical protein